MPKEIPQPFSPDGVNKLPLFSPDEVAKLEKAPKQTGWEHFTPKFVDTKSATSDPKVVIEAMQARRTAYKGEKISQPEATVRIRTRMPITVFPLGDVHWGSVYTSHEQFMEHVKRIEETPNTYVVFMHNLVDNAIPAKFPSNMLVNSIPPQEQFATMQKIIKDMDKKGKVLGAIENSCHEGWSFAATGQSASALLYGYEGRKFPVLENGGVLNIQVGKQDYKWGLYHKSGPFNSNFNKTHNTQQMNRLNLNGEADVVVAAHNHVGAVLETYEGAHSKDRKKRVYVRTGTYKGSGEIHDKFAVDGWGRSGEPAGQSVMMQPDKKEMDASLDFEEGILKHENALVRKTLEQQGLLETVLGKIRR